MPCLTLWPAPECGFNGVCIKGNNGTSFCSCDTGWYQTLEFSGYFLEDDSNDSVCICNHNPKITQGLYLSVLVLGTLVLVMLFLQNFKEQRMPHRNRVQLALVMLTHLTGLVFSVYKLFATNSLIGYDIAATILLLSFGFLVALTLSKRLKKQIAYHTKRPIWMHTDQNTKSNECVKRYCMPDCWKRFEYPSYVLYLMWIILFMVFEYRNKKTALIILRVVVALIILRILRNMIVSYYAFTGFIIDLKALYEHQKDAEYNYNASRPNHLEYTKTKIPITVALRRRILVLQGAAMLLFCSLFNDYFLTLAQYSTPILMIVFQIATFANTYATFNTLRSPTHSRISSAAKPDDQKPNSSNITSWSEDETSRSNWRSAWASDNRLNSLNSVMSYPGRKKSSKLLSKFNTCHEPL